MADTLLDLDPGRVDLWFTSLDRVHDESLLTHYRGLLTSEERQQEKRFYFERDQHSYLVTRALVRTTLSRYAPVPAAQWMFQASAHGRPEILNDHPLARRISFNISHTRGLIVLAVTGGQAVGVDIENIRVRQVSLEVADRFFSPQEVLDLRAAPAASRPERFFHYWTLKESYIKARGLGLSIPLEQFSFHFPPPAGVGIRFEPQLEDDPARWRFWQLRPAAEFLAALCVERAQPLAPQLVLRSIVPLQHEEAMECRPLAMSD
jgi:4'-phosphopantetheinyl transferase